MHQPIQGRSTIPCHRIYYPQLPGGPGRASRALGWQINKDRNPILPFTQLLRPLQCHTLSSEWKAGQWGQEGDTSERQQSCCLYLSRDTQPQPAPSYCQRCLLPLTFA